MDLFDTLMGQVKSYNREVKELDLSLNHFIEADDEVEEGCPKCGAEVWCLHQDIIKADKEKKELLAEKNETRHL